MMQPARFMPAAAVVPAAELGIWEDAAAALAAARRDAARIRAEAEGEREQRRREGWEQGRAEGLASLAAAIGDAAARAHAHLAGLEAALPGLVVEVVGQILGEMDPDDVLARSVSHALARTRRASTATLRVPPGRVAAVRAALGAMGDGAHGIFVESDESLAPDACVISSAYGVAELGATAQLRAFADGFAAAWRREG